MIENIERVGNFTNSEIFNLMTTGKGIGGFGEAAITYIMLTNMERVIGRSVDTEATSRAISWGNLMEPYVFERKLGTNYTYSSKITDIHPTIPYWVGSKDGTNEDGPRAVIDLKNPLTLKSYLQLVMPLYHGKTGIDAMLAVRDGYEHNGFKYPPHKDGKKFYWQLVGGACVNKGVDHAELIVHMPAQSELLAIHELAGDNPAVKWLQYAEENEIPYLPEGCAIKPLNIIRFEVPKADKEALTANVLKAGGLLTPRDGETTKEHQQTIIIPQTHIINNSKPLL